MGFGHWLTSKADAETGFPKREYLSRFCRACQLVSGAHQRRKRRSRRRDSCVDEFGRPTFRDLLFRKRQCIFIAFDLLYLNGKDLRLLPLIERKLTLKKSLRQKRSRILYLDHVEADGRLLFEEVVKMD